MCVSFEQDKNSAHLPLIQRLRNNPPINTRETSMVHRYSWLYRSWSREYITAPSDGQVSLVSEQSNVIEGDCSNYRNKSLYGFRMTTLLAWVLGDTYKSVRTYYRQLLPHTHLLHKQVLVFLLSRFTAAVQGLFRLPIIN